MTDPMEPVVELDQEFAAQFEQEWAASASPRPAAPAAPRGRSGVWRRLSAALPHEVASMLKRLVRRPGFRTDALLRAEQHLGIDRRQLGPVRAARAWQAILDRSPLRVVVILKTAADEILSEDHRSRLTDERVVTAVPRGYLEPLVRDGALHVVEPTRTAGEVYLPSYLEVTPPVVIGRAIQIAQTRVHTPIAAWDITAGSGTGATLVGAVGGKCISTDVVAPYAPVAMLDARNVGGWSGHGLRLADPWVRYTGPVVSRPNLVLFDPPARGRPTHTSAYDPASPFADLDLGVLSREEWITAVAQIVRRSIDHLATGGVVSLLLREGTRDIFEVRPDEQLADGLLRAVGDAVVVVDDLRVLHWSTRPQAFAGRARLPMRHVVLGSRTP